jgi:hypothetical protein
MLEALADELSAMTSKDEGGVDTFSEPATHKGVPSVLTDFDSAKRGKT